MDEEYTARSRGKLVLSVKEKQEGTELETTSESRMSTVKDTKSRTCVMHR
jgi:hypothetical protein